MPYVANDLLDLIPGTGQLGCDYAFEVFDRFGTYAGVVDCEAESASIRFDQSANIPRQLSGLRIASSDYANLEPFGSTISPVMILEDGTRWPLGRYRFTAAPDNGEMVEAAPLFDLSIILDALTDRAYGVATGASPFAAMREVAFILGLTAEISGSDILIAPDQPVAWPCGGQSWNTILRYLCTLCGFLPPYFDNTGVLHCRPPDPMILGPNSLRYRSEGDRVQPLFTRDPGLLDAPNVHIVISTGATTQEISASARVAASLPFSVENRGYAVPSVHRLQGIASTAQAEMIAAREAATGVDEFETIEFTSSPDPRTEPFEVIGFDDVPYREIGFTLPLTPGGDHDHRITRSGSLSAEQ